MIPLRWLAFLGLLGLGCDALAWDSFGHMTVAEIAWQKLTPAARNKATALLKLNPDYTVWVKGVAAKDLDEFAFLVAATWPDEIKRQSGYVDDGERPSGADAGRNIGYADKLQHRYWHFVDTPFSPDATPLVQPASPNAKTQILAFRRTLASSTATAALKSYDLAWLLHLVGDVHQPLHATSRFTHDLPEGDNGGNKVALCTRPCTDELHGFWDDVLGTESSPAAARKFAATLAPADPKAAAVTSGSKWVAESFRAAKSSVYVSPIGLGAGPFALDDAYRAAARKLADQRVALAGARLAALLNAALK
jgi:hypothetical protein